MRAACALIGFMSLSAAHCSANTESHSTCLLSEPREMFDAESVNVNNFSPNKNEIIISSIGQRGNLLSRKSLITCYPQSERIAWTYNTSIRDISQIFIRRSGEAGGVRVFVATENCETHPCFNIISRGLAEISYHHFRRESLPGDRRPNSCSFQRNISAKLPFSGILGCFDSAFRMFCLINSGNGGFGGSPRGATRVVQRPEHKCDADNSKNYLNLVKQYGFFGSFRHAPLFAQISLIVTSGLLTMGLGPIGLVRLFPVGEPRRLRSGLALSLAALGGLGLLGGILFLG